MKNPHAVALGRAGGQATSPAKTAAARANAQKRWDRRAAYVALMDSFHADPVLPGGEVASVVEWLQDAQAAQDHVTPEACLRWLREWAPEAVSSCLLRSDP